MISANSPIAYLANGMEGDKDEKRIFVEGSTRSRIDRYGGKRRRLLGRAAFARSGPLFFITFRVLSTLAALSQHSHNTLAHLVD